MNSLVGYGVSSDSDSDLEDGNNTTSSSVKEGGAEAVKKTRNFLLESASASSDSESEDEDPQPLSSSTSRPHAASAPFHQPTLPPPPALHPNKLPSPPLNACSDSSVFTNPFKAQADQRLYALQKHVPLTMQAQPSQIGGKRMCVSYRKDGRCRFGIKCKFAHDSDLQTPLVLTDSRPAEDKGTPDDVPAEGGGRSDQQETKEGESEGQQGKKRRVGLSNTLIPPKRAMKQYSMQRERERINMS